MQLKVQKVKIPRWKPKKFTWKFQERKTRKRNQKVQLQRMVSLLLMITQLLLQMVKPWRILNLKRRRKRRRNSEWIRSWSYRMARMRSRTEQLRRRKIRARMKMERTCSLPVMDSLSAHWLCLSQHVYMTVIDHGVFSNMMKYCSEVTYLVLLIKVPKEKSSL